MSSFRFVHTADLHLDSSFTGLTKLSPAIREVLRDATLQAFDVIVERTIEADAAFLLIAGDIYDGADRGIRAQLRFKEGLERLSREGIQTFIVHGNHDPLAGWSAISTWPKGVTIFPQREVTSVPAERGGERLATVHGISFAEKKEAENLALRFPPAKNGGFNIGLLHCNLGREEHPAYSPARVEDLERAGYHYWALGHIHKRENVRDREPTIVYPGNPQAVSFKSSELEPKGAMLIEVDGSLVVETSFFETDTVRFVRATHRIDKARDLGELVEQLRDLGQELVEEANGRTVLIAGRLEGHGQVGTQLSRPGACQDLLEALRESDGSGDRVWWARLDDASMPEIHPEALAGRDDFHGAVASFGRELQEQPARLAAFALEHANGPAKKWAERVEPQQLRDVLERSVLVALEALGTPEDE